MTLKRSALTVCRPAGEISVSGPLVARGGIVAVPRVPPSVTVTGTSAPALPNRTREPGQSPLPVNATVSPGASVAGVAPVHAPARVVAVSIDAPGSATVRVRTPVSG